MGPLGEYAVALLLSGGVAVLVLHAERVLGVLGRVVEAGRQLLGDAGSDRPAPPPLPGSARPIELIAVDVHRLRRRYRTLPERGVAYAKTVGIRRAYDGALAEACACLEIVTLLGVLPDGPELDLERTRVERALDSLGFGRADAA